MERFSEAWTEGIIRSSAAEDGFHSPSRHLGPGHMGNCKVRWSTAYSICRRPPWHAGPVESGEKSWKKRIALALGWRSILNRAAFVHCLNQDEERLLAQLGLTSPTAVIPNGIFLEEIDALPESFAESQPNLRGRPFILFLGRLHIKRASTFWPLRFEFWLLNGKTSIS